MADKKRKTPVTYDSEGRVINNVKANKHVHIYKQTGAKFEVDRPGLQKWETYHECSCGKTRTEKHTTHLRF